LMTLIFFGVPALSALAGTILSVAKFKFCAA
jgi:hypothetical protein